MLGYQSERQLQQLFSDLARLENRSEDERLSLARIYDFNPRNAFQRIDRYRNYNLDVFEIKDFLRDQGKFVTNSDVELLIQQHDTSGDNKLNNREFESMVLPQTDRLAADHTFQRRETYVGKYDNLSRDIERTLGELLFNEIMALRGIEDAKNSLKRRYDFSRYEAFKTLDKFNAGSILRSDLIDFVKRAGGYATYIDTEAVFRRLDKDQDGKLNYSEVCDFLDSRPAPLGSSASRNSSPLRQSQTGGDWRSKSAAPGARAQQSSVYGSPLRQTLESRTAQKKEEPSNELGASADKSTAYGSPSPQKREEQASPEVELQPRKLEMDELEEAEAQNEEEQQQQEQAQEEEAQEEAQKEEAQEEESKAVQEEPAQEEQAEQKQEQRQRPPALSSSEEFDLFWNLKRFVELENETERAKTDLALRYDFNLFDAFRVVDEGNHNEVFRFELTDTLKKHGVYANREEIELFYRKFDKNRDGKLRFSEFADAIAPKDRMAADALNRRQSNYRDPRPFSSLTMDMFERTFRTIFNGFAAQNDMNRRLREKPAFFISAAFERLDSNGNGFVSKDELQRFFDEHRHFATSRELDLLVARFDSNGDGRITYSELFEGLSAV